MRSLETFAASVSLASAVALVSYDLRHRAALYWWSLLSYHLIVGAKKSCAGLL